jgi:kumamolisin
MSETGYFLMRERRTRLLGALIALTMLSGCGSSAHKDKPTPTPTATRVGAFTTLDLGLPSQAMKAPVTGRVPGGKTLHVGVTLKVSDSAWKQFGHGKSPSQSAGDIGKKLGISDATLAKIQGYLARAHIRAKPSRTRTSLTFDVRAGVAGKLLQTSFVTHRLNGRSFFTPDPAHPPKIPTQIAPYVLAVTGLESYTVAPRQRLAAPRALPTRAGDCIRFPQHAATSRKVAAAYGYDRLWAQGWHGENMTVNLVEMDGYDQRDVANYIACTGSRVSLSKVNLGLTSPRPGGEATLDIQMLAGLSPSARIIDYEEDPALLETGNGTDSWTAFNNSLQRIIDDNSTKPRPGSVVSISLGGPEGFMSQATMQAVDQSIRILTQAENMTVFVASGDCGAYADRVYGPLDVSFPASSTWAVAVGGTRMAFSPTGARTQETVWSDKSSLARCENQWGSGGGLSKVYPRPWYQQGPGVANQFSNGARQVPDIAAAAIDLPVYFRGRWVGFGGTSAATPIWAAGMALVNQALMTRKHYFCYGPDTFYHLANQRGAVPLPYYDVISGDNLHYPATRGYDLSTGLGTPNAPNIFNILSVSPA